MTNIGETKLQGQSFNAVREKYAKGQSAEEKRGQGSEKIPVADAALSMKAGLVDFLLVVKTEAKDRFITQSGLSQRSAGQGRPGKMRCV